MAANLSRDSGRADAPLIGEDLALQSIKQSSERPRYGDPESEKPSKFEKRKEKTESTCISMSEQQQPPGEHPLEPEARPKPSFEEDDPEPSSSDDCLPVCCPFTRPRCLGRNERGNEPLNDSPEKSREEKEEREKAKKALKSALESEDIKKIKACVTPRTLMKCATIPVRRALKVSHKLRKSAKKCDPDQEHFENLAKDVQTFASCLLEPLKSEDCNRLAFATEIETCVDKATRKGLKQFLSHPVVYDFLHEKWFGEFVAFKTSTWTDCKWWAWLFLNLWTFVDIILFPVLLMVFWIFHAIIEKMRAKKDLNVCFVLPSTGLKDREITNQFRREIVGGAVKNLGHKGKKFAFIPGPDGQVKSEDFKSKHQLTQRLKKLTKDPWRAVELGECLKKAKESFGRTDSEKVLVVVADYKSIQTDEGEERTSDHRPGASSDEGTLSTVAVSIGPTVKKQLEYLTDKNKIIFSNWSKRPEDLGKRVAQKIHGRDIFEWYCLYFLTPHFIFLRDTVSYIALLALHCAVCLVPSTLPFNGVEIALIVLFLGRILMELQQIYDAMVQKKEEKKPWKHKVKKHLKRLPLYFRDLWNAIDLITIVTFLAIFVLRLEALRSSSVPQNEALAAANYLYGLNTMLLTLRVLGRILECSRTVGVMQIALFKTIGGVTLIFWQLLVAVLSFSMAMTKVFMAEKSYKATTDRKDDRLCAKDGVFCWWDTVQHLLWSVLRLSDTDKLGTADDTPVLLLRLLYAMFLIMVVILLVNMLIAALSNVYQGVMDNSLAEWCYKFAIANRTYCSNSYHPIPVPLNLLTMPCKALWKCCSSETQSDDKERKKKARRKMMETLERRYVLRYGYSFPPTDKRKMDMVIRELSENRRITNHIAERVFSNNSLKGWEGYGITVEGNTLTYVAPDGCQECENLPKRDHSVRYREQLNSSSPAFEVLIQECGDQRLLSIGVWAQDNQNNNNKLSHGFLPGWMVNSVGYSTTNGRILFDKANHQPGQDLDDGMAYRGDIITCRIHPSERTGPEIPVSFSRNGKELGRTKIKCETGALYPCIGMGSDGMKVQFTMGRFSEITKRQEKHKQALESQVDEIKSRVDEMNGKLQDIMSALKEEIAKRRS